MANYNSIHTGPQIDEGVAAALPDGRLDMAIAEAIDTAVSRAVESAVNQLAAKLHAESHAAGGTDVLSPAAIQALALDGSGTMTGNLVMSKGGSPQVKMVNETTTRILYLLNSEATSAMYLYNQLDANNYHILRINPETESLADALKLVRRVAGVTETHTLLHTGNMAELGIGNGGLVMLKTLTVPEEGIEELEFQLTVDELTRYKRFVIFPKLEVEYDTNATRSVFLEAPSFGSDGISLSIGPVSLFPTNSVAFIAVGTEGSGWGYTINMLSLKTYHSTTEGATAVHTDQTYGTSTSLHPNPTTDPLTFRIIAYYPFIKGGTVSIMGVN